MGSKNVTFLTHLMFTVTASGLVKMRMQGDKWSNLCKATKCVPGRAGIWTETTWLGSQIRNCYNKFSLDIVDSLVILSETTYNKVDFTTG